MVRTSAPSSVTRTVCSNWAVRLPVDGDRGPPVVPQHVAPVAQGDHGLDGERHARLHDRAGRGSCVVGDLQVGVELLADAVAHEVAHHPEPVGLGVVLDGRADVGHRPPRPHRGDAQVEALPGDLHQPAGRVVDRPHQERGAGVAVDAVEVDGDVEVDDVAVDQGAVVGDAVADDLVHRRAQRLGEAVVVERAGVGAPGQASVVGEGVEVVGGDARAAPGRRPRPAPRPPPGRRAACARSRRATSPSTRSRARACPSTA